MKKASIGLTLFLIVVVAGALFLINNNSNDSLVGNTVDSVSGQVKTISVSGENFKFVVDGEDNPTIYAREGDRVVIEFKSTAGLHDFVVDELDVSTKRVGSGESTSVEFVADKAGTFSYYCSVGDHRAKGMEGKFIIE
ncbi:hypothetical protein COU53_00615 [Candidatus Pacearchaeota archaeon CG10_big_fil_rev_8_21_14_0_10_30_48]|nr:MAG: hypothetical protein COU53_00615 [Candidatus Pacearchaeota archaeon CG10_big_fil_rev_8_21_14_0_10_30_48]